MPNQESLDDKLEKAVAEKIWLEYFNNYLYEHGVITEKERNRMVSEINACHNRKRQKDYCNSDIDML